ncbi:hypothetical protein ZIOFF_068712 [Zingiber officinale]|uniref:Uncharacterized protein n=1 Tax=Zingiber officinale TaxID=94328 RepID=A0A8J5CYF0_ZINOF|nr:hypothetical protein ZIOFF_068712 [Zingiber officinale]
MRRVDARNRSTWPSVACRIHEPWHAMGCMQCSMKNDIAKGSIRPKPMKQNHGPSTGHSGGAIRRLNQVGIMAGGNHEIRKRLSFVEALLGAVPDGEDVCNLVARILNLEANLEQIQ